MIQGRLRKRMSITLTNFAILEASPRVKSKVLRTRRAAFVNFVMSLLSELSI